MNKFKIGDIVIITGDGVRCTNDINVSCKKCIGENVRMKIEKFDGDLQVECRTIEEGKHDTGVRCTFNISDLSHFQITNWQEYMTN